MITIKKLRKGINANGLLWFRVVIAMMLMIIGMDMNFTVIESNKGMPVKADYTFTTDKHFSFNNMSEIKYPYLADILSIPSIGSFPGLMFSFGDCFLIFGFSLMLSITLSQIRIVYKMINRHFRRNK